MTNQQLPLDPAVPTNTLPPRAGSSTSPSAKPHSSNLTKKASLNAVASLLDYGMRMAVEFLLNPLMVAGLGDYMFGAWRVLWRLTGYLQMTSGRAGQALKWSIAHKHYSNDLDEKRRLVASSLLVWLLFVPVTLLFGGFLIWFMPISLHTPPDLVPQVRIAMAVLIANVLLLSLASIPQSALQGENMGYKRMGLSAGLVLFSGLTVAGAVYFQFGLVGVTVATLFNTFLSGLLFLQVARSHIAWFGIARPSRALARWFVGLSWWFMLWKLVAELMTTGDVVVLGMLGSVEMVTVYTLTKYLPESIISVVATVVFGIAPGMGGIIGSGQHDKAARLRSEINAFTFVLATIAGVTILIWNYSFVSLWIGPEYDAGVLATLLITIMTLQYALIRNDANFIDLTLVVRDKVLTGLISAAISVGVSALLVGYYDMGIPGLCIGVIAGRAVLSITYPYQIGRLLGNPLTQQLRGAVRPIIVATALFAVAVAVRPLAQASTWLHLVIGAGLTGAVLCLTVPLLGLTGQQRHDLLRRIRSVVEVARERFG
jgi:O-antigen/teichoic acid export membrane protein